MHAHSGSRRDPDSTHNTRKDTWYCNCHTYVPPWFEQVDSPLDQPLTHAYFSIVLTGMLRQPSAQSLKLALRKHVELEQQLRAMSSNESTVAQGRTFKAPHLRMVTLAASKLLVVLCLAARIAERSRDPDQAAPALLSDEETDLLVDHPTIGMGALVDVHPQWASELMHCLACELRSLEDVRNVLRRIATPLLAEVGEWMQPWIEAPPADEAAVNHTKLSFAVDQTHALHAMYQSLAGAVAEGGPPGAQRLVQTVRQLLDEMPAGSARQRRRLDLRMLLLSAIYYERGPRAAPDASLSGAVDSLRAPDLLALADHTWNVFRCFLDSTQFVSRHADDGHDYLCELLSLRQRTRDETELQACMVGLIAVTIGMEEGHCHLCTHLFHPGALPHTFGVGNQYDSAIMAAGIHYDCGCELDEDGEIPRNRGRPQRGPLSRHSLYFVLWSSYTALAASMVTQPDAERRLHGPVLSAPGQDVRQYMRGIIFSTWQHLATKVVRSSDELCVLALRTLEALREKTLEHPQRFASLSRSLRELQMYEGEMQSCLMQAKEELQHHLHPLRRMRNIQEQWSQLFSFIEALSRRTLRCRLQ